ncbi:MAG: hypothetical protein AAFQ85_07280, partial [Pseudomonadota bacterium]
ATLKKMCVGSALTVAAARIRGFALVPLGLSRVRRVDPDLRLYDASPRQGPGRFPPGLFSRAPRRRC